MKTARVIEEHKTSYIISDGDNEFTATVRGAFFNDGNFPKVGDYVNYAVVTNTNGQAVIEEIKPRTTAIVRKSKKTGGEQVIVANVELMVIVMGLDSDFNISRLERYLLLAKQSKVKAVVILNKSDSVEDIKKYINLAEDVAGAVPVHAVSALTAENMEVLLTYLTPNTTAVLLGSSGTGKSTITNWLLQEDKQKVKSVRADDSRGRHTTTARQLFALPSGGYLIDTPGMRELNVISNTIDDESVVFKKIDILTKQCQYSKCDHEKSEGCAVLAAVEKKEISERQVRNYLKLQRERLFEESKRSEESARECKQKKKKLNKGYKKISKRKYSDNQY